MKCVIKFMRHLSFRGNTVFKESWGLDLVVSVNSLLQCAYRDKDRRSVARGGDVFAGHVRACLGHGGFNYSRFYERLVVPAGPRTCCVSYRHHK